MPVMYKKKILIVVSLLMTMLLAGCSFLYKLPPSEPLSADEAKEFLTQHREDIDTIVDYLKELEYKSVFIDADNKKIFYDFEYHDISSWNVNACIHRLWIDGCIEISKNDTQERNAISFDIWRKIIGSEDCGIACTIDGQGMPKTEFQTYCEEIDDGWYYYYDDYEEYRKNPSKYKGN